VQRELGDAWQEALALDGLAAALAETLSPGEGPGQARRHWQEAMDLLADYDDPRARDIRERIAQRLTELG
jgi:hypothetical protein